MKALLLAAVVAGVASATVMAVQADAPGSTVESCASHLPAGHRYVIDIGGVIDTQGEQPAFRANINIKARDAAAEDEEKIDRFVDCVMGLLK